MCSSRRKLKMQQQAFGVLQQTWPSRISTVIIAAWEQTAQKFALKADIEAL